MSDEFDNITNEFLAWLPEIGIELSEKIRLVDLRKSLQGRSMICTEDVKNGDELFRIPYSALLNVQTGSLGLENPEIMRKLRNEIGHWEGLLLTIFYELNNKKETSKWRPYLQIFPTEFDTLIHWSDAELKNIVPSLVTERIGKQSSLEMYTRMLEHVEQFGLKEEFGEITYEDFMRVASTIMAYSFDRDLEEDEVSEEGEEEEAQDENTVVADMLLKSMVAIADILNSDTNLVNANIMYEKDSLVCKATQDIEMGNQIFNIYGDHPNAEILRRYGYVEWDGSRYDFGEVRLQNILESMRDIYDVEYSSLEKLVDMLRVDEKIMEIFEYEDVVLDSYDCYENGTISVEGVVLIQVLSLTLQLHNILSLADAEILKSLQRTVKKSQQLVESGKATVSVNNIWEKAVTKRLGEYPDTSYHLDTSVINNVHTGCTSKKREIMAKCVLKCEVQCLQNCLKSVHNQFRLIEDDKMLRNISKRGVNYETPGNSKRQKRST